MMILKNFKHGLLALSAMILLLFLFSCDRTRNEKGYEYFPDMAHSLTYETYSDNPVTKDGKTNMEPVEGTIPRGVVPYQYPATTDGRIQAGIELKNPLPLNTPNLERGKELYDIFCDNCHGPKGEGEGFLYTSKKYNFKPASLVSEKMMNGQSGEIYHVITKGWGLMGAHGNQIQPEDRWRIVHFVEYYLQKKHETGEPEVTTNTNQE